MTDKAIKCRLSIVAAIACVLLAALTPIACAWAGANAPDWLTEKVMSYDGETVREIRHRAIDNAFVIVGMGLGLGAFFFSFSAMIHSD